MHTFKRAAALAAAVVTIAGLAACTPAPPAVRVAPAEPVLPAQASPSEQEAAESARDSWNAAAAEAMPVAVPELLDTTPISVDEYVARFSEPTGRPYGTDGIDEVNAEYREAAQVFPFALPDGYAFPAETWLLGRSLPEGWQQGDGIAEAYTFWQKATATAAFNDHLRNDQAAASAHLDALAAGYDSAVRAMFVEDPDLAYLEEVVAPAYGGDFDRIYTDDAYRFLGNETYEAVVAHAGDWEYLGTEGYAMQAP